MILKIGVLIYIGCIECNIETRNTYVMLTLCPCCQWVTRNSPEVCNGRMNTHSQPCLGTKFMLKPFAIVIFLWWLQTFDYAKQHITQPPVEKYPMASLIDWFHFSIFWMSARSLSVCNGIPLTLVCHFHSLAVCQLLLNY